MNSKDSVILFKYTSRMRPERFEQGLVSIINYLSRPDLAVFLISIDEDDPHREKYHEICNRHLVNRFGESVLCTCTSKNKIDAINRDLNEYKGNWDILVNMSDDMRFVYKGFDTVIRESFERHFPEGDGYLHFNDGHQKDNVCTMTICDRLYYRRFMYTYHPSYKSVWCDVEQTEVAVKLGRYRYMGHEWIIFVHEHPAIGKAEYDDQYRASENLDVWGEDLKTIIERKTAGYDLPPTSVFKYSAADMENWKRDLNAARVKNNLQPIIF
jgi:hypothetical protein